MKGIKLIPSSLPITELGKGLLFQDYFLKQLSSSLTYPEAKTGRDFWGRLYGELLKTVKTASIPVNTFNKV